MKRFLEKTWPILCVVAVWLIFSSPYFLKGLVPFPSKYLVTFFPPWSASFAMPLKNNAMPDVITQIYPWKKITIETWKSGSVPLWNPYAFAGTPHGANYQTAVFSPFNLLFFLLPMIDAWSVLILLQPLLAGLFMYKYLRELKLTKPAGLVGSFAFMFCGFLVVWMAYGTLGYAALWLPLALFAIQRYLSGRTWWALPLLSASILLSLFSGHFQISLYVLLTVGVYLIVMSLVYKSWKAFVLLGIYFIGGILLAAPQLFPTFVAYTSSLRSGLFEKGQAIPWEYLITIFAPDFYGNPVTRNDWFGYYAEWSSYAGVVTLLLALWAVGQKKAAEKLFWIVAVCLAILIAYPTPLNTLLYAAELPVLSTSIASRVIIIVSFGLSVLAGFGLNSLLQGSNGKKKKLMFFSGFVLLLLIIFWFVLLFGRILPPDKLMIAKRNSILPSALAIFGVLLFCVSQYLPKRYRSFAIFCMVGLVGFEVLRFSTKWMPFDPREYVYPQLPVINFLQKTIGANRVFGFYGGELGNYFSIGSLEGYDAVYQERYGRFMRYMNTGKPGVGERSVVLVSNKGAYLEEMMQLLGIRYVLHRVGDGRNVWAYPFWEHSYYKQVYKDNDYEVYENSTVYPRVFLAGSYEIAHSEVEILGKLMSRDVNRRETLVLEDDPELKPLPGTGSAEIIKYAPTEVQIAVSSPVPKLLFLSDVYDGGWKAAVDGIPSRIYRADYDFRAVSVPAGVHMVIMRYRPESVDWGMKTALVTLAVLGITTFLVYKKKGGV